DRLAVVPDLVCVAVKVEYPTQRLLRRGNVVALRAEHDDRRADAAEIDAGPVGRLYFPAREVVVDEQLVDDELDFFRVQVDVPAPPALEAEITRPLGVDLGIESVWLGPERVRGILIFEILHQPGAVELPTTEIAGERGQPAAAEKSTAVAHGILAAHAGPIGQRRARDDDRAEKLGTQRGQHHDRPAGLAIAHDAGLALGLRVKRNDLFEEDCFGARDVLDRLTGHRLGQEPDEIARMTGLQRDADLAVGLEATDSRAVASARIDNDERPEGWLDRHAGRRQNARQDIVDRPGKCPPIHDQLDVEVEHMRSRFGGVLAERIAALAHDVEEKNSALKGIGRVFDGGRKRSEGSRIATFVIARQPRAWIDHLLLPSQLIAAAPPKLWPQTQTSSLRTMCAGQWCSDKSPTAGFGIKRRR